MHSNRSYCALHKDDFYLKPFLNGTRWMLSGLFFLSFRRWMFTAHYTWVLQFATANIPTSLLYSSPLNFSASKEEVSIRIAESPKLLPRGSVINRDTLVDFFYKNILMPATDFRTERCPTLTIIFAQPYPGFFTHFSVRSKIWLPLLLFTFTRTVLFLQAQPGDY